MTDVNAYGDQGNGPSFAFWLDLSGKIGDLRASQREATKAAKAALRRDQPVDHVAVASGTAQGSSLVLDLGGPVAGHTWLLRRLTIAGATPTTAVAGTAEIYVSAAPTPSSSAEWVDHASTLPDVAYYSDRQVHVLPAQHLLVVVESPTAGSLYVAAAKLNDEAALPYALRENV